MSDFKYVTLEEVTSRIKVGFVGSINDFYCSSEDGVPIIRTTDINDIDFNKLKFVTNEFHLKNKKSQLKKGDLIIARHGDNGNAVIYEHDQIAQVLNAVIIEPDQDQCSSDLLKIFFDSPFIKKQISGCVKGSVQGVINTKHIADLFLNISGNIDYDFVINTIKNISRKIALNNKINAELETMAKLIYDYWFVQFDFPDANGKPYKSSGGKMVYNEELKRDIPEGWGSEYIENLLAKESRTKKLHKTHYKDQGDYAIIDQSTDFICGYTDDKDTVIEAKVPRIVFGDHTRILKLVNFDFARGADGTQVLLSNNNNVPQHFFYHSLLKIDLSSYGYARHFKFLKQTRTIVPDANTANQFEEAATSFYSQVRHNIFETKRLEELRDWLLPMLMNGQVRVKS